jgi:hypothetical protein
MSACLFPECLHTTQCQCIHTYPHGLDCVCGLRRHDSHMHANVRHIYIYIYIHTHTYIGERIAWLIRVEVHGTLMSPFYWAIRDGKFAIAEFMVRDLLSIRADTEDYYYGRYTVPCVSVPLCVCACMCAFTDTISHNSGRHFFGSTRTSSTCFARTRRGLLKHSLTGFYGIRRYVYVSCTCIRLSRGNKCSMYAYVYIYIYIYTHIHTYT